ncbi:hypothetical protein LS684_08645 [Cytobacillus spongiae]|uniref:hypothetical protein n=1 Tax=Cytobacillus spongiae TaxID=2901381 RepID=UPI001F252BC7|nr:hypothetical protein [Cytobacillus spongiae]UII57486.1 hypothetical protein LS684_08645 [Cytobacillus spongiae]
MLYTNWEQKCILLQQQIIHLKSEVEKYKEKAKQSESSNRVKQIEQLKEESFRTQSELTDYKEKVVQTEQQTIALQNEIQLFQQSEVNHLQSIENLIEKNKEQLSHFIQLKEQYETLEVGYEASEKRCKELTSVIEEQHGQMAQLQDENQVLQTKITNLENNILEKTNELHVLKEKEIVLEKQAAKIEHYQKTQLQYEEDLKEASDRIAFLEHKLSYHQLGIRNYEKITTDIFEKIEEFNKETLPNAIHMEDDSNQSPSGQLEAFDFLKLLNELYQYGDQVNQSNQIILQLTEHMEDLTKEIHSMNKNELK